MKNLYHISIQIIITYLIFSNDSLWKQYQPSHYYITVIYELDPYILQIQTMHKNQSKSHKSSSKLPKYSAPKPNCDGCKKGLPQKNNKSATSQSTHHPNKQSTTKLFSIIENFHNNLCSLPLNILLANQNQDQWLRQQYKTLGSLSAKLQLVKENSQVDYYRAKIQTVRLVLENIETNLQTLGNFDYESVSSHRNTIQGYNSYKGSSQVSSIINSNQRNMEKPRWQEILADSDANSEHRSRQDKENVVNNREIKLEKLQKTETVQKQIPKKSEFFKTQKIYEEFKLDKNGVNTAYSSSQLESITSRDRVNEQSIYQINEPIQNHAQLQYELLCQQNKDNFRKSILSIKNSIKAPHDIVCLKTYKSQMNEQQEENNEIESPPGKTKRIQNIYKQCQKQSSEGSIENNSTKIFLQSNSSPNQELLTKIQFLNKKIAELQLDLSESHSQIKQKNKQIESLLVANQQLESVVEIFKTQRLAIQESGKYSLERIGILQQNNEKLQSEINEWKCREKDLRMTINQHEKHIKDMQIKNGELRRRIDEEVEETRQMRMQVKDLILEVEQTKKRQSITREQLSIYKNRNKQLINQQELQKLVSRETYAGKNKKVKELRDILEHHRLNLYADQSLRKRSTLMDESDEEWQGRSGRSTNNYFNI